jgi:hypothetical protein
VFLERNDGVVHYFDVGRTWAERERGRAKVAWPGLFEKPTACLRRLAPGRGRNKGVGTIRDNAVAWIYYCEIAIPFIALAGRADSLRRTSRLAGGAKGVRVQALVDHRAGQGFCGGESRAHARWRVSPLTARGSFGDPSVPLLVLLAWFPVALARMCGRTPIARACPRGTSFRVRWLFRARGLSWASE